MVAPDVVSERLTITVPFRAGVVAMIGVAAGVPLFPPPPPDPEIEPPPHPCIVRTAKAVIMSADLINQFWRRDSSGLHSNRLRRACLIMVDSFISILCRMNMDTSVSGALPQRD